MKSIDQAAISADEYSPHFAPGTPFMIRGCMILQCVGGHASFMLDFRRFDIDCGEVVFLFNDMVIELGERSDDFRIRYVSITAERTFELFLHVTSQKFWDRLYLTPSRVLSQPYREAFGNWMEQCLMVCRLCRRPIADEVIPAQVVSLFTVMEDVISRTPAVSGNVMSGSLPWNLLGKFFVLLARHYRTEHKVAFYAGAMNITPDYLSALMRQFTGKNPKETIEGKLVLAAKAMLESSALSVKNIADRLHFEDSSHLCKMFRRHTGMSPLEYRVRAGRR